MRFPEFKEEWTFIKLKSISDNISYGISAQSKKYDGINKYIRITDIDDETSKFNQSNLTSPDCKLNDFYLLNTNDLLFARTGASTGKSYLYSKRDGKVYFAGYLIRFRIRSNINSSFIFYQTKTERFKNFISIYSKRSGQPGINANEYGNYKFSMCNKLEQIKIALFLSLIDSKIELINDKINILKKYKEGIEKYAYKFVENQGVSIKFSDFFDNLIEKNNHNFLQYTIGKNGIKKIDEIKYDISNHKVFKKFNVIIGIGIDEIGINKDLEYGSVSPVYDVYNIRNFKYFDSIYITLKEQLWKKRNFITRKSTRREFEVDKYELEKTTLKVVDNKDFINVYQSITNIKKVIEILNFSFNNLKIIKSYILRHMFI